MRKKRSIWLIALVLLVLCNSNTFAGAANGEQESDTTIKRMFTLDMMQRIVFNSFGLDMDKISGVTKEVSEAFNKRSQTVSETIEKAEQLEADIAERQRKIDLQIYGE